MWKPKLSENRSWRLTLGESPRRFLTGTPVIWRPNATGRRWPDTFSRFLKTRNYESDSAPPAENVSFAISIWKNAQRFWKKFTQGYLEINSTAGEKLMFPKYSCLLMLTLV